MNNIDFGGKEFFHGKIDFLFCPNSFVQDCSFTVVRTCIPKVLYPWNLPLYQVVLGFCLTICVPTKNFPRGKCVDIRHWCVLRHLLYMHFSNPSHIYASSYCFAFQQNILMAATKDVHIRPSRTSPGANEYIYVFIKWLLKDIWLLDVIFWIS